MQLDTRRAAAVVALTLSCALTLAQSVRPALADDQACDAPPVAVVHHSVDSRPKHVFIIVLENESYDATFRAGSQAPYLSKCLAKKGQLLKNYYGIGHNSLDNYIAMISGQSPNPDTQLDCPIFTEFSPATPGPLFGANGQALGHGCVYPTNVTTIASQLEEQGLKWRGYMEDMSGACEHPQPNEKDDFQRSENGRNQYATKHNPFVYFRSIDPEDCAKNDVPLDRLNGDLKKVETTPNLSFIVPNLCHDGHDHGANGKCSDGTTDGGLAAIDSFLRPTVKMIMDSKAYQQDGMLIITFDEAETGGDHADARACCNEPAGPNTQSPGMLGPGGGRIGAVIISPFVKPGSTNSNFYNHYSLLRSLENLFRLSHLGYAEKPDPGEFGNDVYTE